MKLSPQNTIAIHLTKKNASIFAILYNWYIICRIISCKIIAYDRLILVKLEGLTILIVCKKGCSQLNILYITLGQLCMLKAVSSPKCIMLVYLWLNRLLNISQNVFLQ